MSIISKALQKAQEKRLEQLEKKEATISSGYNSPHEYSSSQASYLPGARLPVRTTVFIVASSFVFFAILIIAILGLFSYINRPKTDQFPEQRIKTEQPVYIKKISDEKTEVFTDTGRSVTPQNTMIKPPVLNGIMYSTTLPKAVINGVVVSKGESIDGFDVVEILPDRVRLSRENKKFELEL